MAAYSPSLMLLSQEAIFTPITYLHAVAIVVWLTGVGVGRILLPTGPNVRIEKVEIGKEQSRYTTERHDVRASGMRSHQDLIWDFCS